MARAMIIRTIGDPELCGAIADGMTRTVIPLDDGELALVRAECARLRARNDIRAYGDSVRLDTACKALAIKYQPEAHGWLYWAVVTAWALLWLGLGELYDRLEVLTREA